MYRENYINSLRTEMVDMVRVYLSPVALKYGYSDVPLETTIKWRPMVLILGNYSSGKSTLINEFLGADIQAVGQAPTDDSFTIITYDEAAATDDPIDTTEVRDGKFLLNDPEYPFEILKKHGHRFAAHFRLKKVNSPFLRNLALIDTPGMLDSITERDRGYNYQDVIGDMAQLADLVLVLFDPHKAGTVRESHTSLRETISTRTFEDRVLFVLNRIDECASLADLLQVYGTLCWNLSQITGRKDIPTINLTYSSCAATAAQARDPESTSFLYHLQNQRKMLKKSVLEAPQRRLDNLATFIETHSERLDHFLEALINYRVRLRKRRFRFWIAGTAAGILFGGIAAALAANSERFEQMLEPPVVGVGVAVFLLFIVVWQFLPIRIMQRFYHRKQMKHIDQLIPLGSQTRKDSWQAVRGLVSDYLSRTRGHFSMAEVKNEYKSIHKVYIEGTREVRTALNEVSDIMRNGREEKDSGHGEDEQCQTASPL
ncbi:MAG: dynamin family protein [Desulfosalsimonadaceae bacterium]